MKKTAEPYAFSPGKEALASMTEALLFFSEQNARDLPWRKSVTPYRVWVSEIMLQQTRAEVVRRYFDRFLCALPTPRHLAEASPDLLAKLWEGLGYYRRANLMQKAAQVICRKYGGELPADYQALRALPGFGEYTAGAVASFAFGLRAPAVDGNLLRVLARLIACEDNVLQPSCADRLRALSWSLLPSSREGDGRSYQYDGYAAAAWNQAMMELGAQICLPNTTPKCHACPLSPYCRACAEGSAHRLPVRISGTKRREENITVLRIVCGDRCLLHRRPDQGLLAGLYELLNVQGHLTEEQAVQHVRDLGFCVQAHRPLGAAKHVFTHITWHMQGYELICLPPACLPDGSLLVTREALLQTYSVPGAFRAYHPFATQ